MGNGRRRPGRHRGHPAPPRPRARRRAGSHSDGKNGMDVGEILGDRADRRHGHQRAWTRSSRWTPTASSTRRSIPNRDEVAAILRSGQERRHPGRLVLPRPSRDGAPLAAACAEAGTTLHGTGINPGGITELHPLMFSRAVVGGDATCGPRSSPTSAPTTRPDVVRHIMVFGGEPGGGDGRPDGGLLAGGFIQASVRMVRRRRWASRPSPEHPHRRRRSRSRPPRSTPRSASSSPARSPASGSSGRRSSAATPRGQIAVVNWLMGEENLDPGLDLRPAGRALRGRGAGRPEHAASPSRAGSRTPSRRAWSATPASSPPRSTA